MLAWATLTSGRIWIVFAALAFVMFPVVVLARRRLSQCSGMSPTEPSAPTDR